MIQHDLSHLKLDIGGPKGNVYYILGTCKKLVEKLEGFEAGESFIDMPTGTPWKELGGESWNYNDVLRYIKDKLNIKNELAMFVNYKSSTVSPQI